MPRMDHFSTDGWLIRYDGIGPFGKTSFDTMQPGRRRGSLGIRRSHGTSLPPRLQLTTPSENFLDAKIEATGSRGAFMLGFMTYRGTCTERSCEIQSFVLPKVTEQQTPGWAVGTRGSLTSLELHGLYPPEAVHATCAPQRSPDR